MLTSSDLENLIKIDFYSDIAAELDLVADKLRSTDLPVGDEGQSKFPKACTKCGEVFQSVDQFMDKTVGISDYQPDICYKINGLVKLMRYRNCPPPCNSTLVVVNHDRRALNEKGLELRKLFSLLNQAMLRAIPGLSKLGAHNSALYLYRAMISDSLSASEAYFVYKEDLRKGYFRGFKGEQAVIVEEVKLAGGER